MILYNLAYRGPYDYDKLILNVLQYHNEALTAFNYLNSETDGLKKESTDKIKELSDNVHLLLQDINIRKEMTSI